MTVRVMLIAALVVCGAASESAAQETTLFVSVADGASRLMPGVHIRVTDLETGEIIATQTTGANGTAIVRVASSHGYSISALLAGHHAWPITTNAPPGEVTVPLTMAPVVLPPEFYVGPLPPASSLLTGVVRSTTGRPIPDATVDALSSGLPHRPTAGIAKTGPDGSYRLVVPGGHYIVRAQTQQQYAFPRGQSASSVVTYAEAESLPISALVGSTVVVDLVMKPNGLLFPVTVRVLDDRGRPVDGALVEWFAKRNLNASIGGKLPTDARGLLALGAIAAGPVTVIATTRQGDSYLGASLVAEVINAPMDPITLRVRPASRVLGLVEFTDRQTPLHGAGGLEVWVQREGRLGSFSGPGLMNADGTFSLGPVAGEGCLRVYGIPSAWRLSAILHRGEDLQHRFLQFDAVETYDLIVRIEPGVDDTPYVHPTCVRTASPTARR